jgi:hypothetical protein
MNVFFVLKILENDGQDIIQQDQKNGCHGY